MRMSGDTAWAMTSNRTHIFTLPNQGTEPAIGSVPRCLLAITRLAPGVTASALADIFKRTRGRHRDLGIVGAMLFDGEHFGLLLCGESGQVGRAFDALLVDPRQALPVVLFDGPNVPSWAARGWRSGWSEPDGLATLAAADSPRDGAAMQALQVLIGASDLL